MMEAMNSMMQRMSAEDLAAMTKIAGSESNPLRAGGLPSDPDLIRQCMSMVNTMDEDSLVQMIEASGMCKDPNQADPNPLFDSF